MSAGDAVLVLAVLGGGVLAVRQLASNWRGD